MHGTSSQDILYPTLPPSYQGWWNASDHHLAGVLPQVSSCHHPLAPLGVSANSHCLNAHAPSLGQPLPPQSQIVLAQGKQTVSMDKPQESLLLYPTLYLRTPSPLPPYPTRHHIQHSHTSIPPCRLLKPPLTSVEERCQSKRTYHPFLRGLGDARLGRQDPGALIRGALVGVSGPSKSPHCQLSGTPPFCLFFSILPSPPVIPALAALDLPRIPSEGPLAFLNASLVKAAVTTASP